MAAADFVSLLPHHQMFKQQDADMDNFFDFNQISPQPQQAQPQQVSQSTTTDSFLVTDDFAAENQIFAGPSHQYDQFRQQTGVSVGDLSHLQQPLSSTTDSFFTGLDPSWPYDTDSLMDFGAPATGSSTSVPLRSNGRALSQISESVDPASVEEEQQMSHVGRLWPGMHQQQAQRAAQAKAQAMALRQARASQAENMSPFDVRAPALAMPQLRQSSIAPSVADDDTVIANGFMPNAPKSAKKEEDDLDEDERLLASEEGKKLSSKERRQLRNKVSARAFRSRRKEYITHLEGEINGKAHEVDQLKSANVELSNENARYRHLIQFLIRQPAFAPVLSELSKDPAMSSVQGLALLPPTGPQPAAPAQQRSYNPNSQNTENSSADPSSMLDTNIYNLQGGNGGLPFNFQ